MASVVAEVLISGSLQDLQPHSTIQKSDLEHDTVSSHEKRIHNRVEV